MFSKYVQRSPFAPISPLLYLASSYTTPAGAGCWFLFPKESHGSILLSRKTKALNKYYDKLKETGHYGVIMGHKHEIRRIRWKVQSDEQRASLIRMISISCHRSFRESREVFLVVCGILIKSFLYSSRLSTVEPMYIELIIVINYLCIGRGPNSPALDGYSLDLGFVQRVDR